MPQPHKWTAEEFQRIKELTDRGFTRAEVGAQLGFTPLQVRHALKRLSEKNLEDMPQASPRPTFTKPPSASRDIDTLLADMAEAFVRKKAHHEGKQRIVIDLPSTGAFMLMFTGDGHLADPGCDIEHLSWCLETARSTKDCYLINMGDLGNFWIGNLGRLYAHQPTTDDEERIMVEWLISKFPWLFVIEGNHDKWSPIVSLLCRQHGVLSVAHGGFFHVRNASGGEVKIDCRHTHRGNSMYNPSFGQAKRSYRGSPADLIVGAHIHTGAYTLLKNGVTGNVNHCIRVGAFKKFDEYADANGFDNDSVGPVMCAVCRPSEADPLKRVTTFADVEDAIKFLEVVKG
jgi:hypothetical protein